MNPHNLTAREELVLDRLRFLCRHGDVAAAGEFASLRDPEAAHPCGGRITADKARRALRRLEAVGLVQSFDGRPRMYAPVGTEETE